MTFPGFQEWEACFDEKSVTLSCPLETAKRDGAAQLQDPHAYVVTTKLP